MSRAQSFHFWIPERRAEASRARSGPLRSLGGHPAITGADSDSERGPSTLSDGNEFRSFGQKERLDGSPPARIEPRREDRVRLRVGEVREGAEHVVEVGLANLCRSASEHSPAAFTASKSASGVRVKKSRSTVLALYGADRVCANVFESPVLEDPGQDGVGLGQRRLRGRELLGPHESLSRRPSREGSTATALPRGSTSS
jgi:hypothetical protein